MSARTDPCGGQWVTTVPTATASPGCPVMDNPHVDSCWQPGRRWKACCCFETSHYPAVILANGKSLSLLYPIGMKIPKERFIRYCKWSLVRSRRIGQHVEWSAVAGFFGFVTLGTALLRDYPHAWFPITMAIIGIGLVLLAAHNSYLQKSASQVEKYDERFFERMESERESAAAFLLGEQSSSDELEEVLDYLEYPIAQKVVSGALDVKQVYDVFYHWIRLYWQAGEAFIKKYQKEELAAYTHLKTLYEMTSAIEKREKG